MMVDLYHGCGTAVKRPGAGHPSPRRSRPPWPRRKAFGLRRDGGVLAWELGKSCGRGQKIHVFRLNNKTRGICHAEFSICGQVWQINAAGCDLKDPKCFH